MKLRNLNGAIRKVEGAPTVGVMTPLGYIHVPVQKTGLLDALKALSDDPQIETHMEVSEDGRLTVTEEGRVLIERAASGHGEDGDLVGESDLLDDDDDLVNARARGDLHDINVERFCGGNAAEDLLDDAPASDDLDDLLG